MVKYGGAIKTFPVEHGSHWVAGPHHLWCGDCTTMPNDQFPAFDVCYTDPPWSQGNTTFFFNYANLPPRDFFTMMTESIIQIKDLSKDVSIAGIEVPVKYASFFRDVLKELEFNTLWDCEATYHANRLPHYVIGGSFKKVLVEFPGMDGLHGMEFCKYFVEQAIQPGHIFFEPFCGECLFIIEAAKKGAICYGVELIPDKLALGLVHLKSMGYGVKRID